MTQRRDLQALIDAAPVGKMQWRVIICCFLVVMLDGFDTAAIGFIAPDIRTHWQLSASELAPLFGAGLLGLTAGALLCGPLADRFGRKRVIELCVALFGALSLLSAFSPDIETLVLLRFLTGLGLGGAMPNTITMTSEYLPARRRGALVTLMFCGFTLGSAMGGIVSAQLVPLIGWHGILALGGILPLMLFFGLLFALPESPRWQVRRQLPQAVVARTVSAITGERYHDTCGEAIIFALIGDATNSSSNQQWRDLRGNLGILHCAEKNDLKMIFLHWILHLNDFRLNRFKSTFNHCPNS